MNLFEHHHQELSDREAPLAARMRPRSLDEFIGQDHIIGPGRLLRRAIAADQISSLIFYGPPGTGKTTLAQIIANTTRAHFIAINAVLSGVKDIRGAIAQAQERRGQFSQRTILFVDEVHRFNKAQQDALLPWVENGTIVLIGATTENPYFEVNKALVSRSRLFQLRPLAAVDLVRVVAQAIADGERGYGDRPVQLDPEARDHLVNVANGDARALLNALELAVETTPPDTEGTLTITLEVAEESIQRRAVLYDKEGDSHFDTISALIKSIRGSDPDAALYWLARMVYSGEDPRFIFRRLIILASEDVGLADPQAISIVTACATAFDRIGLPEGQYPLAQATLYLSNAPKSNSTMGFFAALDSVQKERADDIPNALKDNNRDGKSFGHGANYKYPHAYRDHWVAQQYLPSGLQGQVFYEPSDQGWEGEIALQVQRRREAQIAAIADGDGDLPEVLSFGPVDQQTERWIQRAMGQASGRLGKLRDRLFAQAQIQRHHVVLVLNAGSGLLLWEALRQVPEGGVYAQVQTEAEAQLLQLQAQDLPELRRPQMVWGEWLGRSDLPRAEQILGRNAFAGCRDLAAREALAGAIAQHLAPQGHLRLIEILPSETQRLYSLLDPQELPPALYDRLKAAEEHLYKNEPSLCWGAAELRQAFERAGLAIALEIEPSQTAVALTSGLVERWFDRHRPESYGARLGKGLSRSQLNQVRAEFQRRVGQALVLNGAMAWITAHPPWTGSNDSLSPD